MENGKSIQLSGSQLSKAWRWITYRSYKLKRWNISGGRVSSLLKSRVLCKKIITSGGQRIRLNLKTTQHFGFWKTCFNSLSVILSLIFFFFFESFYFCTFSLLYSEMIEARCLKNCRNMNFRIIIIVSFLKMQCAFWRRGWPLRLFEISFEPTEDATTCIIVSITKCLNICGR